MAQVKFELDVDNKGAEKAMLELVRAQGKSEGSFTRQTRAAGRLERGLGRLKSQVTGVFTSYLSVTTAINTAAAAFQKFEEMREQAARRNRGVEGGRARLAQLAGGDQQALGGLFAKSDELALMGMSRSRALDLTFALESASLLEQRQIFGRMAATRFVRDPETIAAATKGIQQNLPGRFTVNQILSQGLVAAGKTPSNLPLVLRSVGRTISGGVAAGFTPADIFSATGLLATTTTDPALAGAALTSLFGTFAAQGIQQPTIPGAVRALQAKAGGDTKRLVELVGKERFKEFQTLVNNLPLLERQTAEIRAAQTTDVIGASLRLLERQPGTQVGIIERRARVRREIAEEDLGERQRLSTAVGDQIIADMRDRGRGDLRISIIEWLLRNQARIRGPEAFIDEFTDTSGLDSFSPETGEDLRGIGNAARNLNQSARRLDNAAGATSINEHTE